MHRRRAIVRFLAATIEKPTTPTPALLGGGWVLWSHYALVLSGALLVHVVADSPGLLFVAVVACLGHALLVGGSARMLLPPAAANTLAMCACVWVAWEMRLPRQIMPHSVARFLVVVLMVKLYGRRDSASLRLSQFALLAVLLAVSREGLQVSFLWSFLLCLGSMALSTMSLSLVPWASGARSRPDAPRVADVAMGGWAPCLAVVICAAGMFAGFPRFGAHGGTLGVRSRGPLKTGYTGEVSLRHVGEVVETSEEALRVRFVDGNERAEIAKPVAPPRFLLRGATLVRYRYGKWSSQARELHTISEEAGWYWPMANPDYPLRFGNKVATQLIRQYVEPGLKGDNGVGMSLYLPLSVNDTRQPIVPVSQNIRLKRRRIETAYQVLSLVPVRDSESLKDAVAPERTEIWSLMWDVPKGIRPVLQQVIEEIEVESLPTTDYERVQAVLQYLQDPARFTYTLNLPPFGDGDPLVAFLQTTRRGSCQQFASAMVLILRTWGLPARLVAGYRCDNYNPATGWYVCRGRDAHAWVDVFFNDIGWVEFDPTPGGSAGGGLGLGSGRNHDDAWAWWRQISVRLDMADSWVGRSWDDHVVRFGPAHQRKMHRFFAKRMVDTRDVCRGIIGRLWPRVNVSHAGAVALVAGGLLAGIALVVVGVYALSRWSRRDHGRAARGRRFYRTLLRMLERRGLRRAPSTTPREFAALVGTHLRAQPVDGAFVADAVDTITELYCRVRFGRYVVSADEQNRIAESLRAVAAAPRGLWRNTRRKRRASGY
jgi:transglutaminase superfamily protein/uncharacterized protein DUF4129